MQYGQGNRASGGPKSVLSLLVQAFSLPFTGGERLTIYRFAKELVVASESPPEGPV